MDYSPLFARLNRAKVRYLVVGGVAVGLHGFLRSTHDVDLMIDLEPANLAKAMAVLQRFGLKPHVPEDPGRFADPAIRARWIREKGMVVFPWYHPKNVYFHVDVFVKHPVPFPRAYARRKIVKEGRLRIPVVGLVDLLRMKRLAGRDKDQEDIRYLLWRKKHDR